MPCERAQRCQQKKTKRTKKQCKKCAKGDTGYCYFHQKDPIYYELPKFLNEIEPDLPPETKTRYKGQTIIEKIQTQVPLPNKGVILGLLQDIQNRVPVNLFNNLLKTYKALDTLWNSYFLPSSQESQEY